MGQKETRIKRVSTSLDERQIKMLMDTTHLKRDEIMQWHVGFLKDCPCGLLDKAQFSNSYKQLYPGGKADKFCKLVFDAFDKNGDGTIDFNEFLIATSITLHGNIKEKLELAFDMYDTDRNRVIDQKELEYMLQALMELKGITPDEDMNPKKRAKAIMESMDINGDHKINKEEFIHGCLRDPHMKSMFTFDSLSDSFDSYEKIDSESDNNNQRKFSNDAYNFKKQYSFPGGTMESSKKLKRSLKGELASRSWQKAGLYSHDQASSSTYHFKKPSSFLQQSTQL